MSGRIGMNSVTAEQMLYSSVTQKRTAKVNKRNVRFSGNEFYGSRVAFVITIYCIAPTQPIQNFFLIEITAEPIKKTLRFQGRKSRDNRLNAFLLQK